MTLTAEQADALARARARNLLVREIRARLKGQGLDIRERNHALVITSPGNTEQGSIHINLATGEASLKRTLWNYLGYLPGYGNGDIDEPRFDTHTITATLTQPGTGPHDDDDSR